LNIIIENLKRVNTDGLLHPQGIVDEFPRYYEAFERRYRALCDAQIDYHGRSLAELTEMVRIAINCLAKEWVPPAGELWADSAQQKRVSGRERAFYRDYTSVLAEAKATRSPPRPLTISEMKAITAGGYQAFDANSFPPTAAPESTAFKKQGDLRWEKHEFEGRSVLEIGCQLGFFTFQAAALGARQCLGLDISKRFVDEANKISVNYKLSVCGWHNDMVRFALAEIIPGRPLPFKPDIIVANSIVHWWMIQNKHLTIHSILEWLHDSCRYGLYFEGCVSADEEIMRRNNVPLSRYNEEAFLEACHAIFGTVVLIGRCSYDPRRLVVRLLKRQQERE